MVRPYLTLLATLALAPTLLAACGGSSDDASNGGGAGGSAGAAGAGGAAGAAGSGGTAGSDAGGGDAGAGGGGGTAGSGGGGGTAGSGGGGGTAGSGGGTNCDAGATGTAVTGPDDQWTWVPVGGAKCRDGSDTGFAINFHSASDQVMVYLEGGGACFNGLTCGMNPSKFGESDFNGWKGGGGKGGVFDRGNAANPVKDFNFVYIPYCTGDVHVGNNPGGTPPGSTAQQFVGYVNVGLDLQSIVPSFPNASRVLLTGVSAGGFGAALNYDQVQRAFGCTPVDLIDDSGPPMSSQYLHTCLQSAWRDLWGFDKTVLADCGADCPNADDYALDFVKHLAKTHSDRFQGLVESTKDNVISSFYSFGENNCQTSFPNPGWAPFQAGLEDARQQLAPYTHFGTFIFAGTDHTSIGGGNFYTRTTAGTKLTDWFAGILAGTPTNVGP